MTLKKNGKLSHVGTTLLSKPYKREWLKMEPWEKFYLDGMV
jgi:hypothetical protein